MGPPKPSRERVERVIASLVRNHGSPSAAEIETGENRNNIYTIIRQSERWYGIKYEKPAPGCVGKVRVTVQAPSAPPPPVPPAERPVIRMPAGNKPIRVLAIGDAHDSPALPKDRFHWMGRHAAESRPDWIIQIGDLLTLDSLNSHEPNDTLGGKAKPAYLADIVSGKEALDAFNTALPSDYSPRKHITLGNHEHRINRFEQNAPETVGMMRNEMESILSGAGWNWSEYGQYLFVGGVGFTHVPLNRLGRAYGGKNAEQTVANDTTFDLVYGHSHIGRTWRAPKIGPMNHVTVLNLGCALPDGHVEAYAAVSTTGWTWGVYDLLIHSGHIQSAGFVPMAELERRYR